MLDTILNLFGDLKTCLAVALGSGFVLGYLYTKLKAREMFKPEVKGLLHRVGLKKSKLQNLVDSNAEIESVLTKDSDKLNQHNLELSSLKSKLKEEEKNRLLLQSESEEKKGLFDRENRALLNTQDDIQTLKTTLDIKDITKLPEHKKHMEENIQKLQQTYQQKNDSLLGLEKEKQSLDFEIASLKDKLNSLDANVSKKEFELFDVNKKVATIEDKFQLEFDALVSEKNSYEAKIERYKRQLLDIQKTL